TSSGWLTIAWAIPTRRSIPPDSVRSLALALSPRPTCSTAAATAPGTRRARGPPPTRHPRRWQLLQQREVLHELHHREARVVAQVLRQVAEPASDLPPRAINAGIRGEQPTPARGRRATR